MWYFYNRNGTIINNNMANIGSRKSCLAADHNWGLLVCSSAPSFQDENNNTYQHTIAGKHFWGTDLWQVVLEQRCSHFTSNIEGEIRSTMWFSMWVCRTEVWRIHLWRLSSVEWSKLSSLQVYQYRFCRNWWAAIFCCQAWDKCDKYGS